MMSTAIVAVYDFVGALEAATLATNAKNPQDIEGRVYVAVTATGASVEATDRFRASAVDLPRTVAGDSSPATEGVVIRASDAAAMLKALKLSGPYQGARMNPRGSVQRHSYGVQVSVEAGTLATVTRADFADRVEIAAVDDVPWPDVRRLFRGTEVGVMVNAGALNAAADGLSRLPDANGQVDQPFVTLTFPPTETGQLTVAREDLRNGTAALSVACGPVPSEAQGKKVTFNPGYLRDAIKSTGLTGALRKAAVTLWLPVVGGPEIKKPVRFTAGGEESQFESRGHLLVPIRRAL
jgi:hypothetical protein